MTRPRHNCLTDGQWAHCCICDGRIHLPGCTSKMRPDIDCCPIRHKRLYNKLIDIIHELKRCALQNEKDAGLSDCYRADSTRAVVAVASEQRRVIRILKELLKET